MKTLIDQWLIYVKHMYSRKPKTIAIYSSIGRMFVREWPDKTSLSIDDVETFVMKEVNRGISNATINQKLAVLKVFLNWAIDHKRISDKPKIKLLKVPKIKVVKSFSPVEVTAILNAAKGTPVELAIWFALMAGLRREEIRFLKWNDVDLEKRVIYIRAKNGFSPKSHNERVIPISEQFANKLIERRRSLSWVVNVKRNQVNNNFLEKEFNKILNEVDLYRLGMPTWHRLRHTFASRFIEAGGDIQSLKDIMGHCNISTTQTYMHSNPTRQRAVIDGINL